MASQMKMQRKMLAAIEDVRRQLNRLYEFNGKAEGFAELRRELMEKIRMLVGLHYDEARIEQVVEQVVENAKKDLIKMIVEEKEFKHEETVAAAKLKYLQEILLEKKGIAGEIKDRLDGKLGIINSVLDELRRLITKKAATATAMASVSQDLAKLVKQVQKAEK